jgi:hypothetical protein
MDTHNVEQLLRESAARFEEETSQADRDAFKARVLAELEARSAPRAADDPQAEQ